MATKLEGGVGKASELFFVASLICYDYDTYLRRK